MKRKTKKASPMVKLMRKLQKGDADGGAILLGLGIFAIASLAYIFAGGVGYTKPPTSGTKVAIVTPRPGRAKNNLQLITFRGATLTPPPTTNTATQGAHCQHDDVNEEDIMVIGLDLSGGTAGGDIRAWYTDEHPPFVSIGEVVDPTTGNVTKRGNTTIKDTCSSGSELGLSFEPTLTINGKNYFPDVIKGEFQPSQNCEHGGGGNDTGGVKGPAIDDFKPYQTGTPGLTDYGAGQQDEHTAEFIWHMKSLGLPAGSYAAQVIGHDGDHEIGIMCATINIK
jgi:hypothetical protein